ncbi:MAG TPA: DUF1501 domain-containing protein [Lacipirellulaceae bacterium]|nr:DUF1501 domain-containing protein [Lacipirellulaceae bacterium]
MSLPDPASSTQELCRRRFLDGGLRLGQVALAALVDRTTWASTRGSLANPLAAKSTHFRPRARNVIQLLMTGGPSHLDMFDYKPKLAALTGQPLPESVIGKTNFAQIREGRPLVMSSPWGFRRHGQSGQWVSDLLPHTAQVVDSLTFVRTVMTTETVHPHAEFMMNTGHRVAGRPSLGAWLMYGLGSESDELPGYIVINSNGPTRGKNGNYHNGFLAPTFQGVELRSRGEPILNANSPPGVTPQDQRQLIDAVNQLNDLRRRETRDPETAARISAYELAFKLQASVPDLVDLRRESAATLALYGCDVEQPSFARDCLLARRLVERGVRFVQIHFGDWDHHSDIAISHPNQCRGIDQACAALVQDLQQRGLLDETLVIWGGEFGRTPVAQPQSVGGVGRDHHINAFTMWMAGGGLRPGSYGETDEFGFNPVGPSVEVHDLHATILHLLGMDHERLLYRFQARNFRLTDVYGRVLKELVA